MSLAFYGRIVLISKLVGWWRTRTRKVRKPGADYPSVPSASDARDAKGRQRRSRTPSGRPLGRRATPRPN